MTALVTTPRTFIDMIGNPGNWPHLSSMGMATQLEVDACLLGTIEVIGLVVEDNSERGERREERGERLAAVVRTVITADDGNAGVDDSGLVDEQVDAGIAVELLGLGTSAVVFVVAETGIDGSLQAIRSSRTGRIEPSMMSPAMRTKSGCSALIKSIQRASSRRRL